MKRINVTKSYLPPMDEYIKKIESIWENSILTNYGPYNNELVDKLKKYLNVDNLHYVTNGTVALQLCIDGLDLNEGEIITTPFTFVATSSSILWQRCKPVFVDIDKNNFNIDVSKIEEKITKNTKAILAVHCFGFPCDVDKIDEIAKKHNLLVIYDAAHTFGAKIGDRSLVSYGDVSACSLHATKVFHTVEGGLCVVNNPKFNEKINSIKNFGTKDGNYKYVGINAKNSEFHAAMGLCVFNHLDEIFNIRKRNYDLYVEQLKNVLYIPSLPNNFTYNYIYFPVVFENEAQLLKVFEALNENNIYPRRYFYPAINDVDIYKTEDLTPIAHDISTRIACLPLDTYLTEEDINIICSIIRNCIAK